MQGCTPSCHPHGCPRAPRAAAGSRAPSAPAARPIDGHFGHSRERLQLLGCSGGLSAPLGAPPAPGAVVVAVVAQAAGSHYSFHGSLQAERDGISRKHTHTPGSTPRLPPLSILLLRAGIAQPQRAQPMDGTSSVQEEESGRNPSGFTFSFLLALNSCSFFCVLSMWANLAAFPVTQGCSRAW